MLELEGVRLTRAGRQVLDGVDLHLERGAWVGLCGPNGAGKSSLLGLCAGDLRPDHGHVHMDGHPPRDYTPAELARRRAVLSQDPELAHPYRVEEVVALGHPSTPPETRRELLHELDCVDLAGRIYTELSGGERRIVQLARVLLQAERAVLSGHPPWLLLDEPVSQFDLGRIQTVMEALDRRRRRGWGLLVSLHDLELASRHADRLLVLAHGSLLADGAPAEALTSDILARGWQVDARIERETPSPGVRIRFGGR